MKKVRPAVGILVLVLWGASVGFAQTPQEVNRAIDRGVDFLKSRQQAGGAWEDHLGYEGGETALITLALLSCDVPPDSPKIQAALDYLRRLPPRNTYVVSLQTMVLAEAFPKRDYAQIRDLARWLMRTKRAPGVWSYGDRDGNGDNSNTQYALLGLRAASEAGVEIPDKFWTECRAHWLKWQSQRGSWGYQFTGDSGSMTVAGISSLVITARELDTVQTGMVDGKAVRCNGARDDQALREGIGWISRNFTVAANPGGQNQWVFYYLYGLERAGRLSGQRFFGEHDWYRRGSRLLVQQQKVDGSWNVMRGDDTTFRQINTAFALLFLSKGRIPIVVNKLKYGADSDWANAPNDVNNLTDFLAKQWNVKLNWQIVDSQVATVEDLLQAPVLTFNGHHPPRLGAKSKKLIRDYIEQGGLLMVDSNCACAGFDEGFRKLCQEIFPEPDRQLKPIEPGHGVWNSLFNLSELSKSWPLYGIDVGCRTAVFYSPEDLSCHWEHHGKKHKGGASSVPALRLGSNIIAYATGPENLVDKLVERKVVDPSAEDEIRRNFLQIAKIKHNGDWNPAPRAIANLLTSLKEIAKIDVIRQQRDINVLDPNFSNYPLVYMHGRNRFILNKQEKERLAEHLRGGGVLFADACCGSERFDEAFRQLAGELFPGQKLQPIPANHAIFTTQIGYDLNSVQYAKSLGDRKGPPTLEGIELDGRYVVIYSKYDLGCAMEKQQSSDCKGYVHDSAIKIASNIVLYALKQ